MRKSVLSPPRPQPADEKAADELMMELGDIAAKSTEAAALYESRLRESEQRCVSLESEKAQVLQHVNELQLSLERAAAIEGQLQSEIERTRCEFEDKSTEMSNELKAVQSERDSLKFVIDELRSDLYSEQRSNEASLSLLVAKVESMKASAQLDVDRKTAESVDLRMSLKGLDSERNELAQKVTSLQVAISEQERHADSLREQLQAQESAHHSKVSELVQELHGQRALLESERTGNDQLRDALDSSSRKCSALETKVNHLNEVNRVLGVRLKACTAENEANQMEREARVVLQRQNAEMEEQISQLRRTITSMIPM